MTALAENKIGKTKDILKITIISRKENYSVHII